MNYSDKVLDHFSNPRNVGVIDDANVVVQVGDPDCGDSVLYFLKFEKNRVQDIKYLVKGCGAAIATSSIASEIAKGRTLDALLEISEDEIATALDGLPAEKMHCSNLAASALRAVVQSYRDKLADSEQADHEDPMAPAQAHGALHN
ncbi:MAG: iron-sulfur cluster assembly scaffold protein [Desulfuromonas sp.]|nr:MAG: iron-sulfur cluster assembly scaffold protein [Desulfuromonas sp.]